MTFPRLARSTPPWHPPQVSVLSDDRARRNNGDARLLAISRDLLLFFLQRFSLSTSFSSLDQFHGLS